MGQRLEELGAVAQVVVAAALDLAIGRSNVAPVRAAYATMAASCASRPRPLSPCPPVLTRIRPINFLLASASIAIAPRP